MCVVYGTLRCQQFGSNIATLSDLLIKCQRKIIYSYFNTSDVLICVTQSHWEGRYVHVRKNGDSEHFVCQTG